MDRERSAACLALTSAGRRCLQVIEQQAARSGGPAVLSREHLRMLGIARRTASVGLRELQQLGFISIGHGSRRVAVFTLHDEWRSIDADTARRRVALARLPKPPPVRTTHALRDEDLRL